MLPEIDSATPISYTRRKFQPFEATFHPFGRFFTRHAHFRLYFYFRFKTGSHICVSCTRFLTKTR